MRKGLGQARGCFTDRACVNQLWNRRCVWVLTVVTVAPLNQHLLLFHWTVMWSLWLDGVCNESMVYVMSKCVMTGREEGSVCTWHTCMCIESGCVGREMEGDGQKTPWKRCVIVTVRARSVSLGELQLMIIPTSLLPHLWFSRSLGQYAVTTSVRSPTMLLGMENVNGMKTTFSFYFRNRKA